MFFIKQKSTLRGFLLRSVRELINIVLQVESLNKFYDKNHVLKDVTFKATNSNILGLLGRNGHGKSTIIKSIMGIINFDSGNITIDGKKITTNNFKLGYLPEERGLYQKVDILDQIIYFGKLRGLNTTEAKKRANEFIERLELTEYRRKKAKELSKGNQQKVQLAIALLNDPDILILDEPYSGLDPVNSKLLQDIIENHANRKKLVIFSSHELGRVEDFCDDVVLINYGEIVLNGSLKEIKKSYPKTKIYLESYDNNFENIGATPFKNGYIVNFYSDLEKKQIFENIKDFNVDTFKVVEPTLLEIFLEKVGEKTGVEL